MKKISLPTCCVNDTFFHDLYFQVPKMAFNNNSLQGNKSQDFFFSQTTTTIA